MHAMHYAREEAEDVEKGKFEEKAERLGKTAAELLDRKEFEAYAAIYEHWFPGQELTLESFKSMPRDITKLFAVNTIGMFLEEYLGLIHEGLAKKSVIVPVIKPVLLKMLVAYHVDLIDITEELARRKFTEPEIYEATTLFI